MLTATQAEERRKRAAAELCQIGDPSRASVAMNSKSNTYPLVQTCRFEHTHVENAYKGKKGEFLTRARGRITFVLVIPPVRPLRGGLLEIGLRS